MTRIGLPWSKYRQTLEAYSRHVGQPLTIDLGPQPEERRLARELSARIHSKDAEVLQLLNDCAIRPTYFRHHLSSIAKWSERKRRLLNSGGNFQLLESLSEAELAPLQILELTGTRAEQEETINRLRHARLPQDTTPKWYGWHPPAPAPATPGLRYRETQKAWVYPKMGVNTESALAPIVARSLIQHYVKGTGKLVADPMCGGGVVPLEARRLGHAAWASDKFPQTLPHLTVAEFDLYKEDIRDRRGYDDLPDADLMVLHPPTPTWFREHQALFPDGITYEEWLGRVIENSWPLVAQGGHLALIVILGQSVSDVAGMMETLLSVIRQDLANVSDNIQIRGHHIAVSKDGREGWHILTIQKPINI